MCFSPKRSQGEGFFFLAVPSTIEPCLVGTQERTFSEAAPQLSNNLPMKVHLDPYLGHLRTVFIHNGISNVIILFLLNSQSLQSITFFKNLHSPLNQLLGLLISWMPKCGLINRGSKILNKEYRGVIKTFFKLHERSFFSLSRNYRESSSLIVASSVAEDYWMWQVKYLLISWVEQVLRVQMTTHRSVEAEDAPPI